MIIQLHSQRPIKRKEFSSKPVSNSLSPSFSPVLNKPDTVEINFSSGKLLRKGLFKSVAMLEGNPKWEASIKRERPVVTKLNDLRSHFERDYNRIMHSDGNDRLRYKAQSYVFVDPQVFDSKSTRHLVENDNISTRSTHVAQVEDIAKRICKTIGLNDELAAAIALGHDIGHSPFGHEGEKVLRSITTKNGLDPFWHEKNSLRMVDDLLTLENSRGKTKNLNLTYAVRDGIICHCGEVDQNGLKPRGEILHLPSFKKASQVQPFTWEGCVVKVSDKIAYLGRDIEDAYRSGTLDRKDAGRLKKVVQKHLPDFDEEVNNTSLINLFTKDLVENSSPEKGIGFSKEVFAVMKDVKKFNYENIYGSKRQKPGEKFFNEVLGTIFEEFSGLYKGEETIAHMKTQNKKSTKHFVEWLEKYSTNQPKSKAKGHKPLYDLSKKEDYNQAIVDYISGMTDKFAQKTYHKISREQKKDKLVALKAIQRKAVQDGDYGKYKKARQAFAKEIVEDKEPEHRTTMLNSLAPRKIIFKIRNFFSEKTPEERILDHMIKIRKLEIKHNTKAPDKL